MFNKCIGEGQNQLNFACDSYLWIFRAIKNTDFNQCKIVSMPANQDYSHKLSKLAQMNGEN